MVEIIDFSIFKQEQAKKQKREAEIKTETKILQKDKIDRKKLLKLLAMALDLISKIEKKQYIKLYYDKYFSASGCSDIEIIRKINNFDEQNVSADPILYSALIDVARDRMLRV